MTAIIDYDAGNIKSVEKALLALGEEAIITINLPTWAEEAGFDGSQDPGDYRLEDMCALFF